MLNNIKKYFKEKFNIGLIICLILVGFICASLFSLVDVYYRTHISFTTINYISNVDLLLYILSFVISILFVFILSMILNKKIIIYYAFLIISILFSLALTTIDNNIYLKVGVGIILLIISIYLIKDDKLKINEIEMKNKTAFIITIVFVLISTVLIYLFTSMQYRVYSEYSFDFGIFAQMFENMAKTFLPHTTIERGYDLSHFAVHFSPIFYLFLPGYMLWRSPLYLYFIQAFMVALGAIPVYLIAKELNLSSFESLLVSLIYLVTPAFNLPLFYDFHENKFLTVIILFIFYFILKKKTLFMYIFSGLLLTVKEDAVIYLVCISLYVLFTYKEKKMIIYSIIGIISSLLYFVFAVEIINYLGGTSMSSRLDGYYLSGENPFIGTIKTILLDCGYFIKNCFIDTYGSNNNANNLIYLIWVFFPLLFTPFFNNKISSFILLIPLVVENLMMSWPYQHNIEFQYNYGSVGLIFISMIIALKCIGMEKLRFYISTILIISFVFTESYMMNKSFTYSYYYSVDGATYRDTDELFNKYKDEMINESVSCDDRFTPKLYYVTDLRSFYYGETNDSTYYVILNDKTYECESYLEENYYILDSNSYITIYKKK